MAVVYIEVIIKGHVESRYDGTGQRPLIAWTCVLHIAYTLDFFYSVEDVSIMCQ